MTEKPSRTEGNACEKATGGQIQDKAGQAYWDQTWQGELLPTAIDPLDSSLRNHVERCFHKFLTSAFAGRETAGQALLEVGSARSRWLPYFAKEFGFEVTGIDYSALGCEQAKSILRNAEVSGNIVLADFFSPPDEMLGAFDIVVSFGVIEHFEDTAACVTRLTRFLRPGGMMITSVPNMAGSVGWMQRHVCRSIYDVHVPLNREALLNAHQSAGLTVLSCDYFMNADPSVVNFSCWSGNRLYGAIVRLPFAVSLALWFLDEKGLKIRLNRWNSRYVNCTARK